MSTNLEEDRVKELQASFSMNQLRDLITEGKITEEMADIYGQKINRLNDAISHSIQNHKKLHNKSVKLRQNVINERVKLESAHNIQKRNQLIVKELNQTYTKGIDELTIQKENHRTVFDNLKHLKLEKEQRIARIQSEKTRAEMAIKPEEEKYNKMIRELEEDKVRLEERIKEQKANRVKNEKDLDESLKHNAKLDKDLTKIEDDVNKIRDDPSRYERNLKMLQDSVKALNTNLNEHQDYIKDKKKRTKQQRETLESLLGKLKEHESIINRDSKKADELLNIKTELDKNNQELGASTLNLLETKKMNEATLMSQRSEIKGRVDSINKCRKNTDRQKKEYKKTEHHRNLLKNVIYEYEMTQDKIIKERAEHRNGLEKFKYMCQGVNEEQKIMFEKKKKLDNQEIENKSHLKRLKKKISEYEAKLSDLQKTEAEAIKTVKDLTTIRETMARKASAALAEVRETREELKIKELLILDLTKKQQEIEFKLNSFKALYEEVKGARNKYVNLIQNASQDLAELKERIKISQNELEILKNESSEKERTLNKLSQTIQSIIHERDKARSELNKLEYKKKALIERGNQQANEIAKLNMITLSLQNDMLEIRKHYEAACESRNYMGVQLIDRNDELCILYEKNNIQENIIRNGETEIKRLEDDIRMIAIEIKDIQGQIDVARKKIPQVPILADKIVQLNNELDNQKTKENDLSEKLEDPKNVDRLRELGGEDPDQEALEAKIQVLEERLNMKKEALLEKELILDEVTNLSENLRKQALEGRYSTLEISSKVNELQARLKKITRKMMATISELSMFQANVIKLEQQKEDSYNRLENVRDRVDEDMPPTDDAEILFLKMLRDKKRYQEQIEAKMQQEIIKKNMSPFAVRTTAEPRPNAYIDEIGLPRPYGKFRPFKPSELGANLRHYRNPKQREIEI